jgi:xanthine dehydrogenase YagT iron-sulfur-binding subunit
MDKDTKSGHTPVPSGFSRRGFLGSVGEGVIGVAAVASAPAAPLPQSANAVEGVKISLTVNEQSHRLRVEPRQTLLEVLRDSLGLAGTKPGCERGECGACTVLIDGVPRYSCQTLAVEAEGHSITTIEGLGGEKLSPVQQGFIEQDGMQCGYCTPGQVMAAEGLLRRTPDPTFDEIRMGMSGNLCRCGAYDHIFKSVKRAAVLRKSGGAA